MPLLRKQAFQKQKPPPGLQPEDEVFHCTMTNEIFVDYEQFFERVILCNSLVWTCALTGRPGLTYQEALDSEEKARKQLASFPDPLQKPILYLATLTHRSRLADLSDDIYTFAKERYFVGELVEVAIRSERKSCRILRVLAASATNTPLKTNGQQSEESSDDDVICLDDPQPPPKSPKSSPQKQVVVDPKRYQYVVQDRKGQQYTVKAGQLNRKKGLYTREKNKLYLKQHCESGHDGIWRVKVRYVKKHKLAESSWSTFWTGPAPVFQVSESKRKPKVIDLTAEKKKKAQNKKEKKTKKEEIKEVKPAQMSAEERADLKERLKQEKMLMKEELKKKLEEEKQKRKEEREKERQAKQEEREKERVTRQDEKDKERLTRHEEREKERLTRHEEREKEREKKREEKCKREEYLREWNKLREDMECDDLKALPRPTPVQIPIPSELFGDVMYVLEYLNCFNSLFDLQDAFPSGITLENFSKSLSESEMNGVYFELLKFLLQAIFNLQTEEQEEEEELQQNKDFNSNIEIPKQAGKGDISMHDLVRAATHASRIPQLNYGCSLSKLPMDCWTITEVIRLHFLSAGAEITDQDSRFLYQQRGGYTNLDDAGLQFRRENPQLLETISRSSVFDLTPEDKLKILKALLNEMVTYVACREFIEDNCEKSRQTKMDLRQHRATEERRAKLEAAFWWRKKCEEKAKEREAEAERKAQRVKAREERLRLDEMRKRASAENRGLRELLKSEGQTDLIERLDLDAKEAKEKQEGNPSEQQESPKIENKEQPERHSGRLQKKKDEVKKKKIDRYDEEIDWDNMDWEEVTEEDRARWKEKAAIKEKKLLQTVSELQHGHALLPLGRDRTFRRYWMFHSIPGIFVEDQEEYIPDDYLQPVEQTHKQPMSFDSQNLPLKTDNANQSGEENKSTSSDKENDGRDRAEDGSRTEHRTKVLTENGIEDSTESAMDTDSKLAVYCESVQEQISNRNKFPWSFYDKPEQLDRLIESLNPRGIRESSLRVALQEQKVLLQDSLSNCPADTLCMGGTQEAKDVKVQAVKSRKRMMQGKVYNSSAGEVLELNLREMLLDLEERMYAGSLGAPKVKDRVKWREALENGGYEMSCENLIWSGKTAEEEGELTPLDDSTVLEKMETDEVKEECSQKALPVVRDLAKALLQIEQGIEPKYLNPPLGEDEETKKGRQQAALEVAFKGLAGSPTHSKKDKQGSKDEDESSDDSDNDDDSEEQQKLKTPVERWEQSLMSSTSLAQVFLHINPLENSITWDKSALNARCRICRRKGDAEKMLLCDMCDRGHHMYCLKPQVKVVPSGDWYCPDCRPKDIMRTPRKARRKSSVREEEEDEEDSSDEEEEDSDEEDSDDSSDEEDGSEEDNSDEEEEDSDEDDDDDDDDDEEEEEEEDESEAEPSPAKIKIVRGRKQLFPPMKSQPSSGRSTPQSVGRSSRGNTPRSGTPTEARSGRGGAKKRNSLNASYEKPTKSRKSAEKPNARGRPSLEKGKGAAGKSQKSAEKPGSRSTSRSRQSLETKANKRKSYPESAEEDEGSSSKIRGGEPAYQMKQAEKLVNELIKSEDSWPFLKPVSKRSAPDYFKIIAKPMDFSTVRCKINKFEYVDAADILEDVRLIFTNCEQYNVPTAEEYQSGQRLTRTFVRRVKEMKLDSVLKKQQNGVGTTGKAGSAKKSDTATRRSRRST